MKDSHGSLVRPFVWKKHFGNGSMRKDHTATLVGGQLYVVAGHDASTYDNLNDVLAVDCSGKQLKEQKLRVGGETIPARNGHSATLVNDKIIVLGGWRLRAAISDVYSLDLIMKAWKSVETYGPKHPVMNMHSAEYAESWHQVVCFGGGDGNRFVNVTTCLSMDSLRWYELNPKGNLPDPRASHSSCMVGSTYFIFGGWKQGVSYNDVHLLHLWRTPGAAHWSSPSVKNIPTSRSGAGMAYFHGLLVVFGGYQGRASNDLQIYDIRLQSWLPVMSRASSGVNQNLPRVCVTGSNALPRVGHSLTNIGGERLLVFGGPRFGSTDRAYFTLEQR